MSSRTEILDGKESYRPKGLIYTEVLGWMDLGHAQGTDIINLLDLMSKGESSGKEFYEVRYSQGMTGLRR